MDTNNTNNTWRADLPQDVRQKIVRRIMDTLQRHMPPTEQESMGELSKIAWRLEEKTFHAATDQQDYLRKMSLIMLSLETKAQAAPATAIQARLGNPASVVKSLDPASVDSLGHSGAAGLDHREVVWPKLQVLKDKYLQDMKELYAMLSERSTLPMHPEQLQKLKHYMDVLQRMIPYLTVPKERVPREFNQDKVEAFEMQIVNIMETFKRGPEFLQTWSNHSTQKDPRSFE